mmetsp:Transcript_68314/g.211353  ORF Transcript_68314/g.211353 Transcript_68314/m.211353 type:complete len:260 (-) Transcript_68314:509-1288(-)
MIALHVPRHDALAVEEELVPVRAAQGREHGAVRRVRGARAEGAHEAGARQDERSSAVARHQPAEDRLVHGKRARPVGAALHAGIATTVSAAGLPAHVLVRLLGDALPLAAISTTGSRLLASAHSEVLLVAAGLCCGPLRAIAPRPSEGALVDLVLDAGPAEVPVRLLHEALLRERHRDVRGAGAAPHNPPVILATGQAVHVLEVSHPIEGRGRRRAVGAALEVQGRGAERGGEGGAARGGAPPKLQNPGRELGRRQEDG